MCLPTFATSPIMSPLFLSYLLLFSYWKLDFREFFSFSITDSLLQSCFPVNIKPALHTHSLLWLKKIFAHIWNLWKRWIYVCMCVCVCVCVSKSLGHIFFPEWLLQKIQDLSCTWFIYLHYSCLLICPNRVLDYRNIYNIN